MKKTAFLFVLMSFILDHNTYAQWTSDISQNTLLTGAMPAVSNYMASTKTGKTYFVYHTDENGSYKLWAQLLDQNGQKQFGADGLLLHTSASSWISTFSITTDDQDNLYVYHTDENAGDAYLQKVQPNGTAAYAGSGILTETNTHGVCITVSDSGTDIFVGNSGNNGYNLRKYNASGSLVWMTDTDTLQPTAILAKPDGGCYLVSRYIIPNTTYNFNYLQSYDASGNPIWAAPVKLASYAQLFINKSQIMGNDQDGIYVSSTYPVTATEAYLIVQKVDASGNLLWGTDGLQATSTPSTFTSNAYTQYVPEDTAIYVALEILNASQTQHAIGLQKIHTQTGDLYWAADGLEVVPMSADLPYLAGLSFCEQGKAIIGYADQMGMVSAAFVSNMDTSGADISTYVLNNTQALGNTSNAHVMVNNTGDVVASFIESRSGTEQLFAQNIHCNGTYTKTEEILPVEDFQVNIFPNPVYDGNLYIEVASKNNSDTQIEIWDILGKKQMQLSANVQVGQNQYNINTSNLSAGTYILRIGMHSSKFMVGSN